MTTGDRERGRKREANSKRVREERDAEEAQKAVTITRISQSITDHRSQRTREKEKEREREKGIKRE